MSRIQAKLKPITCPQCDLVSEQAPHYCPQCGWDFWRGAARDALVVAPAPLAVPVKQRGNTWLIAAGVAGLLLAGLLTAVVIGVVGGGSDRSTLAQPTPTLNPQDRIVEQFFWQARSPSASFRMVSEGWLGVVVPDEVRIPYTETFVLDNENWTAQATMTFPDETITGVVAVVDDLYYAKIGDEPVAVRSTVYQDGAASPFARIATVNDIQYVGVDLNAGGPPLHELLVGTWLGGSAVDVWKAGLGAVVDRESRFRIWVDDRGIPSRVDGTYSFTTVDPSGVSVTYAGELRMTFHDWGEVIEIMPPSDEPADQPTDEPMGPEARSRYTECSPRRAAPGADDDACPRPRVTSAAPPAPTL